jgi:hypothetical protein
MPVGYGLLFIRRNAESQVLLRLNGLTWFAQIQSSFMLGATWQQLMQIYTDRRCSTQCRQR